MMFVFDRNISGFPLRSLAICFLRLLVILKLLGIVFALFGVWLCALAVVLTVIGGSFLKKLFVFRAFNFVFFVIG